MAEIKKISTELQLLDKFLDTSGDAGTSGQVLISTGTGINWVSGGSLPGGPYLPLSAGSSYPLTGPLYITSDGGAANGAEIYLKHANNNTTDTIGTLFFGNNADATLSSIVVETNGANNTSNLKLNTSNAGTISTALTLQGDNDAIFTGNVGIGTTSPSQRAVISGLNTLPSLNTTAVSNTSLLISNSDTGYGTYFATTGGGIGLIQQRRQTSAVYYDLALQPYGGNVGIGTTSPIDELHVEGVIQSKKQLLPSTSGTAGWYKIGTMSGFVQGGATAVLEIAGHAGYNAANSQDYLIKLFIKTSNGSSGGPNGQLFNSWYERTGGNDSTIEFKWNNSATNDYDLYMFIPTHSLRSWYSIKKGTGTWDHAGTSASDPGANSSTVLKATGLFNILDANVGIRTANATDTLTVNGNLSIFGNKIYNGSASNSAGVSFPNSTTRIDGYDGITFHSSTTTVGSQSERMRITSAGQVKINTTLSSLGKLSVKSDSGASTFYNNIQCVPSDSTTGGLFIGSNVANDAVMVTGAYYQNAGNYTPTSTSASIINMFSGNIVFRANSSLTVGTNYVPTERMRITPSGNVGIGTTSPTAQLQVGGGTSNQQSSISSLSGSFQGLLSTLSLVNQTANLVTNGGVALDFHLNSGYSPTGRITTRTENASSPTASYMQFFTYLSGLNERMRITSTGKVGIGTDDPLSKLHINDGTNVNLQIGNVGGELQIKTTNDADTAYSPMVLRASEYNILSGNVGIGTTNPTNKLHIQGSQATVYSSTDTGGQASAGTTINNTNTSGNTNNFSQLLFTVGTNNNSVSRIVAIRSGSDASDLAFVGKSTAGVAEYMRIKSGGNVGIGINNPSALLEVRKGSISGQIAKFSAINPHVVIESSTAGNAVLHLKPNTTGSKSGQFKVTAGNGYNFRWSNDASGTAETAYMDLDTSTTGGGDLTVKGDVIAYGSPSDKKYKENIKPIESALDKAMQLQGVTFDWKDSESILEIKEDIGFIAQDVQEVLPELVRDNGKGNLSLRYQGITPILLEAIKELKAEIEELKLNNCNCNK